MRWIIVLALATGCVPAANARQDTANLTQRVNQLEQRLTALEQYIRELYDVLAANGSLAAPQSAGSAPVQPTPPSPSPTPSPTPAPR